MAFSEHKVPVTSAVEITTPMFHSQDGDDGGSETIEYYFRIGYVVIGSVGVIVNALVLLVIFTYTSMRKQVTNLFILNQTFLDLFVSGLIVTAYAPTLVHPYNWNMPGGEIFCKLWASQVFLWSAFMASTYNLLALTIERYMKVVHPITHRNSFTKTKALLIIVVVWLWGLIYNMASTVPTTGLVYGGCWIFSIWSSLSWQTTVGLLTLALQFFVPVVVMAYSYIHMIVVIRRRSLAVAPRGAAATAGQAGTKSHNKNMSRSQKNLFKTLLIVTVSFVVCWSWNEFYFLLMNLGYPVSFTGWFYHFTALMVYVNSCINPFIYLFKYEEFQKGVRKMLKRPAQESARGKN